MNTKVCVLCQEELSIIEFCCKKSNNDGLEGKCKSCSKASRVAYLKANPDKATSRIERKNNWEQLDKIQNPEKYQKQKRTYYATVRGYNLERRRQLRRFYGLTLEEFYLMKGEQNGLCKICRKINDGYELCVDHNHVEGYKDLPPEEKKKHIRGLVCSSCNKGLGNFRDNIQSLLEAVQYLNSFKESQKQLQL